MSVRPIDSLAMATDRLKAAIEEYRAAFSDLFEADDEQVAPVSDGSDIHAEMEAES